LSNEIGKGNVENSYPNSAIDKFAASTLRYIV